MMEGVLAFAGVVVLADTGKVLGLMVYRAHRRGVDRLRRAGLR